MDCSPAPAFDGALGLGVGLPSGTVTFLFTDVEGSTRLWEHQPTAMRAALARHDTLLRQVVMAHDGVVFKTVGDAFHAVFARPVDGLRAALAAQRALLTTAWPAATGPLRVRMALHTGVAEERDGDYFGPPLNRVARLLSAGHGGQVLLSHAVQELVRNALPPGVTLQDLGERRLKDLIRPEQVFQAGAPGLLAAFPPLRSLEAFSHNLPQQLTSFVGREREMAEVKRLLATTHLLTLIGPGGTGKTRLSLQVGADLLDQYADGVWLVELAPLTDPALVPAAVAGVLGVREQPGRPLLATLADYLRARQALLILDNCEHLIAACAATADALLRACPRLAILASSREALAITGETAYRVPSLALPDPAHAPPVERLTQYEAVRLFIDRAVAVLPTFQVTDDNAPAVAAICRQLDGIPLALELAAARVRGLAVEQIAARLDDRFRLLTGGSRTALPRQQTLRALIDWSWDLLTAEEQALWQRLSVFSGGWTLEAAEAVGSGQWAVGSDAGSGARWDHATRNTQYAPGPQSSVLSPQSSVLDLLDQLVNKSLVVMDTAGEGARYRMLETIRQYGRERLAQAGGLGAAQDRHLVYFLALAEEAEPQLDGAGQGRWLRRLEGEHGNLRAALEWALAGGTVEHAARLAGALAFFWMVRGHWSEGRRWLDTIIARGGTMPLPLRAKITRGAGRLANRQGDFARAGTLDETALALYREIGDTHGIASALGSLGWQALNAGDYTRAQTLLEEALALTRRLGDTLNVADRLGNLGLVAQAQGDYARAQELLEESLDLFRRLEDELGIATALLNLGWAALYKGDYARSTQLHSEALARCRAMDYLPSIGNTLAGLAAAALYQQDPARAAALYLEGLAIEEELDHKPGLAECLAGLGAVAAVQGEPVRAARLAAAAAGLRAALNAQLWPHDHDLQWRTVAVARDHISEDAFTAAWTEGRALTLPQALAYARAEPAQRTTVLT